jgi:hypothetical protein
LVGIAKESGNVAEIRSENTWRFGTSRDAERAIKELTDAGYRAQPYDFGAAVGRRRRFATRGYGILVYTEPGTVNAIDALIRGIYPGAEGPL